MRSASRPTVCENALALASRGVISRNSTPGRGKSGTSRISALMPSIVVVVIPSASAAQGFAHAAREAPDARQNKNPGGRIRPPGRHLEPGGVLLSHGEAPHYHRR